MILAWEEDGQPIPLSLAVGQAVEGEYNRMYWVRDVVNIEIKV
jgi:hypothetical protein